TIRPTPISTLFPYTTLFRSRRISLKNYVRSSFQTVVALDMKNLLQQKSGDKWKVLEVILLRKGIPLLLRQKVTKVFSSKPIIDKNFMWRLLTISVVSTVRNFTFIMCVAI